MSRAVELSLTPAIMGFLGSLLDRWLGTWPVFAIAFFVFTLVYVIWKMFMQYSADMRAHEAQLPSRRGAQHGARHGAQHGPEHGPEVTR